MGNAKPGASFKRQHHYHDEKTQCSNAPSAQKFPLDTLEEFSRFHSKQWMVLRSQQRRKRDAKNFIGIGEYCINTKIDQKQWTDTEMYDT
jgi:hypothetical protein